MRRLSFILALLPVVALADQWLPYTDGRMGGCWLNNAGQMYGCTPQPEPAIEPSQRQPSIVEVPVRDPAQDAQIRRAQRENDALRQELESERAQQVAQQQRQAAADAAAYAASPEGRSEQARRDAARCLADAACRCATEGGHFSTTITQTKGAHGEPAFTNTSRCVK